MSLGLGDRCEVLDVDVSVVSDRRPHAFDVVTARSFADVATTCGYADMLLNGSGVALVSEPPTDRTELWSTVLNDHPHLADDGIYQGIRRLVRS